MKRTKIIGLVILAMLVASSLATATAQAAAEGPYFRIEGTRLTSGQTRAITAKIASSSSLTLKVPAAGVTVTCTTLKLASGAEIIGSSGNSGSTGQQGFEASGCSVTGNGIGCKVKGSAIKSEPIKSELVYETIGLIGKLSVEFAPVSGVRFATLEFEGECTVTSTTVSGKLVALFLAVSTKPSPVEVGKEVENSGLCITFMPPPPKIYLVLSGTLIETEPELTAFGHEATVEGEAVIELTSGKKFGVYT
jgi:hypothetical protein